MREIKFRGKRKDNGQWVEGYYVFNNKKHFIITCEQLKAEADVDDNKSTSATFTLQLEGAEFEIDPETLGQYTGRKDKNGREIYEEDIVIGIIDDEEHKWQVAWETDDMLGWNINNTNEPLEIIGNIQENPEF